MLRLSIKGMPSHLENGLHEACRDLPIELTADGIPVMIRKGDSLVAELSPVQGLIEYRKEVEIFRALAHLSREGIGCRICETPCFDTNGLMYDASRNSVPKIDAVKFLLRRMALMGLNLFMLYTEDTYEVDGYPYFGYMRGGFTKEQIRQLDDYAFSLGVEMIPCIQTLGHFNRVLRWSGSMGYLGDTGDVLLVGEEKTYEFIEHLLKEATEPYRSKRIHIGMDEAGGLGNGVYKTRHGERPKIEIFQEHMNRVGEICRRLGLRPMIWSDMYFTLLSPEKDYDPDIVLTDEIKSLIPKDIELVYWDYYHHDEAFYRGVIEQHIGCGSPVLFAGGVWNWDTIAVNTDFMLSTSIPGLNACRDKGIREVFTTAWNDCGGEAPLTGILFGLQLYAEFGYMGRYDEKELDYRFEALNGASAKAYRDLGRFNMVPTVEPEVLLPPTTSDCIFFEDPITLLFEKDLFGIPLYEHYKALREDLESTLPLAVNSDQNKLFSFYKLLASILEKKCYWRDHVTVAVRNGDRKAAAELLPLIRELEQEGEEFYEDWYELWHDWNSDYGWDVIDIRMGAWKQRLKTAERRLEAFVNGQEETIHEMTVEKLPYAPEVSWWARQAKGRPFHFGIWPLSVTMQNL